MFFVRYGYQTVLVDTLIELVALLTALMAHEVAPLLLASIKTKQAFAVGCAYGHDAARVVIRSLYFWATAIASSSIL